MGVTTPACEDCGGPALTHISFVVGGKLTMKHLCDTCADARRTQAKRASQHRSRSAVLILVGSFVLCISVFADQLAFGQSEGFGWRQISGVGIAGLLFLMGALVRVPALLASGLIIGVLALLADWLHFGSSPGFGLYQVTGTVLGLVMLVTGLAFSKSKKGCMTVIATSPGGR